MIKNKIDALSKVINKKGARNFKMKIHIFRLCREAFSSNIVDARHQYRFRFLCCIRKEESYKKCTGLY